MTQAATNAQGSDMSRPWLKSYPPGMPTAIAPPPYRSLGDMIEQNLPPLCKPSRL